MAKIDTSKVKTSPIAERDSKVKIADFASVPSSGSVADLIDSMPGILKANDLTALVAAMRKAQSEKRKIIWMMGAHPIKCGLAPVIVDLAERGYVTHIATNGAGAIHDFEIAYQGATSEDVRETIKDGSFGMAEETGTFLNETLKEAAESGDGYGKTLGQRLSDLSHKENSLFWNMHRIGIDATVHCAVGTAIISQHPSVSGANLGEASYTDFKIFAAEIAELEGGVVMNMGSAVILPEVFLKALSVVRNLGNTVETFTAANFDMIGQYRPMENVLSRPTGGRGYDFRGHHEIMIPLLAAAIKAQEEN